MKNSFSINKLLQPSFLIFYIYVLLTTLLSELQVPFQLFISLPLLVLILLTSNASIYVLISLIVGSLASEAYIKINFFYLNISYLLLVIYLIILLLTFKQKLKFNLISLLLSMLLLVCGISVVMSSNHFALVTIFFRFVVVYIFLISLFSLNLLKVVNAIILGIVLIPLITIINLVGQGLFFKFLTFNYGLFDTVYGSHVYIAWFAFIFPIILLLNGRRYLLYTTSIIYSIYVLFSFSRSLLICVILCLILFYLIGKKITFFTLSKFIIFFTICILIFSNLNFFSFSTDKGSIKEVSNIQRFNKISNSIQAFFEKPIIGHGFGMSQIENKGENFGSNNEEAIEISTYTKFSPEVMPIQILAETGILGLFVFLLVFIFSVITTIKCLKLSNIILGVKLILIISIGISFLYFINSNSFSAPLIYIFLLIPFIFYQYFNNMSINETII